MVTEFLAEARIELGKYAEAQPVAEEAYRGYLELYGPEASRTRKAINRLVELYDAWDKPDEAAEWRAKLSDELIPNEQDD